MNRAPVYLDHMLEAAQLASSYIDGMEKTISLLISARNRAPS